MCLSDGGLQLLLLFGSLLGLCGTPLKGCLEAFLGFMHVETQVCEGRHMQWELWLPEWRRDELNCLGLAHFWQPSFVRGSGCVIVAHRLVKELRESFVATSGAANGQSMFDCFRLGALLRCGSSALCRSVYSAGWDDRLQCSGAFAGISAVYIEAVGCWIALGLIPLSTCM